MDCLPSDVAGRDATTMVVWFLMAPLSKFALVMRMQSWLMTKWVLIHSKACDKTELRDNLARCKSDFVAVVATMDDDDADCSRSSFCFFTMCFCLESKLLKTPIVAEPDGSTKWMRCLKKQSQKLPSIHMSRILKGKLMGRGWC